MFEIVCFIRFELLLLLGHWYEIMALYFVKSILTEISASRQDRRVLQKRKIIRIEFQMGQMGPKMTLGTLKMNGNDFQGV